MRDNGDGTITAMPKSPSNQDQNYSDEEAERRMNEALRRALNTPPKPLSTPRRRSRKGKPAGEDRPAPKHDDDAGV
jgi:hypothetical protein